MTEKRNVLDTVSVPGSIERVPDMANTFIAPIHQMLADRQIRQHGPRLFEVITEDSEGIRIEDSQGRVETVLTAGTFFVSITWDFQQGWHSCYIDYSVKR